MPRIGGDTADLPEGWAVDADNWGTRPERPTDAYVIESLPFSTACICDGMLCVMDAATAIEMDC